jgi:hypothetical protein
VGFIGAVYSMQRGGRRRDGERTGRDELEKAGKGSDSKGYAGERRQRLSDTNPGSAGYSASIYIDYIRFVCALFQNFKKFKPVLKNYIRSEESQMDCLNAIEVRS